MRARIPKGTIITGTFSGGAKEAGRTYSVEVHSVDAGHTGLCHCRREEPQAWNATEHSKHCFPPRPAQVCWVGTAGYWYYADLADVQLLDEVKEGDL